MPAQCSASTIQTFEDISFATGLTGDGFTPNGSATNLYRVNKRWNWQNTLQYDKTFDKHSFSVLIGNEQQYTKTTRWGATRTTVADPFFETFQGNFTNIAVAGSLQGENYLLSYFGRLNYDFNKKYFFSFNARRDGYSAWGDEKWGTFYGGAVAYALSEEAFWKDSFLNKVSYFKVKASYGEVGNSRGIGDFASLQNYNSGLYAANATLAYSQAGNPALTSETSKKTDAASNRHRRRLEQSPAFLLRNRRAFLSFGPRRRPVVTKSGRAVVVEVEGRGVEVELGRVVRGSPSKPSRLSVE